ncbi:unnamed protein product [Thelazia callipaeda]|uniref:Thioredoxin domain-containing protein n=1 Tax=Thelazia callipaeda TaxID=103827 RepID=A0A158RCX8_THECL|nr:unnamed protein product [Thelazia callipaeda]
MTDCSALSRHSKHDLTLYCSKEADKEVGFIRQLSTEELIRKRRKPLKAKYKYIISLSPFELNLIESFLLEKRTFDKSLSWNQLEHMNATILNNAMNEDKLTFVLFWNKESIPSMYAFYLWSQASEYLVSSYPDAAFGGVACHDWDDLCEDYVANTNKYPALFVYKKNAIFAQTQAFRDEMYYFDWVKLVMQSPAQEIHSESELKLLKAGKMKFLDDKVSTTATVAIFNDLKSKEAKVFMEMAENLKGKYHFIYLIKKRNLLQQNLSHANIVYTIRTGEERKRIDFNGVFEIQELTNFVIYSSLPSVVSTFIDISGGYTSEILTHQRHPIILLLGGNKLQKTKFSRMCTKSSNIICISIDKLKLDSTKEILDSLKLSQSEQFVIFLQDKVHSVDISDALENDSLLQIIAFVAAENPTYILKMDDVHPLRHLQVAQINAIFGKQSIEIPTEMQFIEKIYQKEGFKMADGDDYGGCPVMAKIRQASTKDEL